VLWFVSRSSWYSSSSRCRAVLLDGGVVVDAAAVQLLSAAVSGRRGRHGARLLDTGRRSRDVGLGVDKDLSLVRTFPTTRVPVSCAQRSMAAGALTTSPHSGAALHKGERWGASDLLCGALPHGHRRRCEQWCSRLQGLLLLLLFLLPLSFPSLFQTAGGRGFGGNESSERQQRKG
jgi:hypothetical protein